MRFIQKQWTALRIHITKHRRRYAVLGVLLCAFLVWWWNCLPEPLFRQAYSTVVNSKDGKLMGATIAPDGQWRFPMQDSLPADFKTALLTFEDRHFYDHPGINPVSLVRALWWNISQGRKVSGGSTLSMQVIRLSRGNPSRTYSEKALEILMALRLELRYSKSEILRFYAAHAPFGGNVVGLEAAAWRYFGRPSHRLSVSEMATLAVLPNAPALIHPGRNRDALLAKRNRLLDQMAQLGHVDSADLKLFKLESLPDKPKAIPQQVSHLLLRIAKDGKSGQQIASTLDQNLQLRCQEALRQYQGYFSSNNVLNAAVLVLDMETGHCLAYAGNTERIGPERAAQQVDMIAAHRSTGSLLKPMLYAMLLDQGELLPQSLIADVPTQIAGYHPKNFTLDYDGLVPANLALSRSLNVPFVVKLRDFGYPRFHRRLKQWGLQSLDKPADHYGLSLILGGAESTLWQMAGMYASMGRCLRHYTDGHSKYIPSLIHAPRYEHTESKVDSTPQPYWPITPSAIYHTFEAMQGLARPETQGAWNQIEGSKNIAWKTGTSFGNRDAWSIGLDGRHVVGVWVGNATGEGRTGLTGVGYAAPVMFRVFGHLRRGENWVEPLANALPIQVCERSGFKASPICPEKSQKFYPRAGKYAPQCPYHKSVFVNSKGERVRSDCKDFATKEEKVWFVVPPTYERYYRLIHPDYAPLPAFAPDCPNKGDEDVLSIVYPLSGNTIYRPLDLDGQRQPIVARASHRNMDGLLYWHLDDTYLGETHHPHEKALEPTPGKHTLTITDQNGNSERVSFTITQERY